MAFAVFSAHGTTNVVGAVSSGAPGVPDAGGAHRELSAALVLEAVLPGGVAVGVGDALDTAATELVHGVIIRALAESTARNKTGLVTDVAYSVSATLFSFHHPCF